MSRALPSLLAVVLLLLLALPVAAGEPKAPRAADDPPTVLSAGATVPGEVIVKFRNADRAGATLRGHGLAVAAAAGAPVDALPTVVATGARPVSDVLAELRADPAVEYAEPSYVVHLADEGSIQGEVPVDDPLTGGQYSLDRMRVRDAWNRSTGGDGIVAVLDTGVQASHRDLEGRVLRGYDFVNDDTNANDDNGHGTWVAGIIAANANDGYGVAGISWTDSILPVKIMSASGTGSTADLVSGIRWAADHGATVINMSVGGFPYSQAVQDAVTYAWAKGAVLVAAAGNNNLDERFYPASMANVVSVSATQVDDEFSYWSSYGPAVDVSAPGSSVQTTNCTRSACLHPEWGSHTYISGTSFATPNVAGVVALIRARYPEWSPGQVVDRLTSSVDDLGYVGWDKRYGLGRVNAHRALGATVDPPSRPHGDALEPNNGIASARTIPLATTTRPSIHHAGDVDVFAVDVPRAGRLDVRVGGVVDSRGYPWNKSSLKVDPIVELYDGAGALLRRVDAVWEDGTELAQVTVTGPTRIFVRVLNYYANGNARAYAITPTFVDNVPPRIVGRSPAGDATNVPTDSAVVVRFSEPVSGVSASTVKLRDADGRLVPANVSYDAGARRAVLRPKQALTPRATYTARVAAGITDAAGAGVPASTWSFRTGRDVPRIAGASRFETAAALSASAFGTGVPVVYVATGMSYPDALSGGPAARLGGGPLLLTDQRSLPSATAAEIRRLAPGRIVVLGGPAAVSNAVVAQLNGMAPGGATRIAGDDRYATAVAISRSAFGGGSDTVYVATGENYPDALAAGAVAARDGHPILLVSGSRVPGPTAREIARLGVDRIVLVGGPGVIGSSVERQLAAIAPVTRQSGADRYGSAVTLSRASYDAKAVKTVYLATGTSFPDGLSAGPVAGSAGGPLLLVEPTALPSVVANELKRLNPRTIVIVGGPAVVSEAVRSKVQSLWR